MHLIMNNISLSQTRPISVLPRDYANLVKEAQKKKEPVVFLKRNQPVAALVGWELLQKLLACRAKLEEAKALENIRQSEKEFQAGKAKPLKSLKNLC